MTHVEELYGRAPNKFRVQGPYIDTNFGLVEVDWDAKPFPIISLEIHSGSGKEIYSESISLHELQYK